MEVMEEEAKKKTRRTITYQYEMQKDLFANGFVAVNVADVFHLWFARNVSVWRWRHGQHP